MGSQMSSGQKRIDGLGSPLHKFFLGDSMVFRIGYGVGGVVTPLWKGALRGDFVIARLAKASFSSWETLSPLSISREMERDRKGMSFLNLYDALAVYTS